MDTTATPRCIHGLSLDRKSRGIAFRLYLLGCVASAAVLLLAGMMIHFGVQTSLTAQNVFGPNVSAALDARELELSLEQHRRLIEAVAFDIQFTQSRIDFRAVEDVSAKLEDLVLNPNDALTIRIANQMQHLLRLGESVIGSLNPKSDLQRTAILTMYCQHADAVQREIHTYREERIKAAAAGTDRLVSAVWRSVSVVLALAGVALIVIGPISFLLIRHSAWRAKGIVESIVGLARNNTSVAIPEHCRGSDEIGLMARAVDVFRANAISLLEKKERLETVNLWLDIALNNMARGLSMYDANQCLVVCNANYARLYDLPNELIRPGTPFAQVIDHRKPLVAMVGSDPFDPVRINTAERVQAISRISADTKSSLTMKNGKVIEVTTRPLKEGGWVALHEDVTERHRIAGQIVHLARHDAMTGLANRHHFWEVLEPAIRNLQVGDQLALHCVDLDKFKQVNDNFGHPFGDLLLQSVARRLQSAVRADDVVARLGGDEFAVLQRSIGTIDDARHLADRLIAVLSAPYHIQGQKLEIGATVGIAVADASDANPDVLLKNADMALYRGKADGRGRNVFFETAMEGQLRARVALEADLREAVRLGQFQLYYQPIVALAEGAVIGCEALIRWQHPVRGMVSPAEFIPLAEDVGLIVEIGAFAMKSACETAAGWTDAVSVSVNLSAAQFGRSDLLGTVVDSLERSGLAAHRLVLEVTESVILDDNPQTVEILHNLRALGVKIALDDFGTGYSSLSYLKSFPFDKIKIDQSFVRDLPKRADCVAIVRAVAQLARSLSMTTVAEGVETVNHLAMVQAAGCTDAQGYLFSKPVPANSITAVIERCNRELEGLRAVA